jgi:hypothetical protein
MKRYPRTTFLNTQGNHQGRQLAFADWKNSSREKRLISYHEYIHPGYDPERPLCKSNDASCELMGEWQEAYHPTCNVSKFTELQASQRGLSTNNSNCGKRAILEKITNHTASI